MAFSLNPWEVGEKKWVCLQLIHLSIICTYSSESHHFAIKSNHMIVKVMCYVIHPGISLNILL